MAMVKEKTIVTQRIHGNCQTHSRTEISTRDVTTIVDEPKDRIYGTIVTRRLRAMGIPAQPQEALPALQG